MTFVCIFYHQPSGWEHKFTFFTPERYSTDQNSLPPTNDIIPQGQGIAIVLLAGIIFLICAVRMFTYVYSTYLVLVSHCMYVVCCICLWTLVE